MFSFIKKKSSWGFIALLIITAFINTGLPLMLASIFFQALIIFNFISGINDYRKTRHGSFVTGTVVSVEKIIPTGDDTDNYEYTIKFCWPKMDEEYFIKRKISSFSHPGTSAKFRIWVDKQDPTRSIFMEDVDKFLPMSIILVIFFAAICFSEWEMLKHLH